MGRFFLALLLIILTQPVFAEEGAREIIAPPGRPEAPPPPEMEDEEEAGFNPILERRRQRLKKKQEEEGKSLKDFSLADQISDLQKEVGEPRTLQVHASVSIVKPQIQTKGDDYEKFDADFTSFFHAYFRLDNGGPQDFGVWTGFRLAPITGKGTYKKVPGRFGFTYFGPMVGVGKISPLVAPDTDEDEEDSKVGKTPVKSLFTQAWFVAGGVAAQQRTVDTLGYPPPSGEFENGLGFDSPGLWMEATYALVFLDTLSTNAFVGLQTGTNKMFPYFGIGFGLWH